MNKPRTLTLLLLAAGALVSPAAQAQAFPAKPLRITVAAAAGVTNDILTRGLSEPLSRSIGQPVIVENRVGADGIIGTEACVKAAPDGYTLCSTASNIIIWNSVLRRDLPYDTLRDLAPVIHVGFFDSALIVHPSVRANSVTEIINLSTANPDKINWGYFGANSTGYMYMQWLKRDRGAAFYGVPYKTQTQNIQALLVNESSVTVTSFGTAGGFLKAGKLKALAVTSDRRQPFLPEVPTFEEEGIKLPLRTWFGYHYPAAVPRALVLRMNSELHKSLENPAVRSNVLERLFLSPNPGSPEDFDNYIRTQLAAVKEMVAYLGIKPE